MINRNSENGNSETKSFLDQTASENTSKAFIQQASPTSPPTRILACNASKTPDKFVDIAKKKRSLSLHVYLPRCSIPLLISMFVNLFLVSRINNNSGMLHTDNRKPENDNGILSNSVVFGHLHMMKTAGTEINGLLASRFERVCGHKGYSYDAYQFNKREEIKGGHHTERENTGDLVNKQMRNFNRGRVPLHIMHEIGFEDCDYISLETGWDEWSKIQKAVGASIELHIPCREPIDHLMSMCSMLNRAFNCKGNMKLEIRKCMLELNRFNDVLARNVKLDLKCFNPIPIDPYIEYMGDRLQGKRKEGLYIHRDTNRLRNKDKECIWRMPDIERKVRDILVNDYGFFRFCDVCLGTEKELMLRNSTR